jgi:chromosome segregation ATPase
MSDKKKHKNPETPPAAVDAELEAENDREEASEPPKKEAKIPEVITPREKTPEEVVAAYEADDVVIFRDADGSWKEAKLTANPQAVRSGGKVKYKFNVEGKAEAIISTTPLRKVEGLSLVRDLSAKGSVELNGKEYELSVPLSNSGELILGPQGEEEYLLQEVGKAKGQGESRYIDVETVKSIYEAKQAKERFDKDLHELQDKVEQLQGIKTKELYTRLGSLKKDVERITKLMDFNIANSEDADAKELQKINTRIEQLTEKIENAVRDLNKDIRVQGKTAAAREANEATSGAEKGKLKDRQKIVTEVGEEIEESLSAADWRHEHENGAAKKKYDRELKDWEAKNKAARLWDENKRKNIRNPGPRPNPGSKPSYDLGEKPSESKEVRGKLVYDIYKKRPDSDLYVQAVKAEVAKKIERVVGRKVDMSKLDEEVLQLIGEKPADTRAFKKEEDEFNKKKEALDAKIAHNAPLELELQALQQEEQKFQQELKGIDAKAAEYDVHAEQEAVARKESNKKRIELNNLQPKTLDPARVKELRDQRDLQEQLLGTVKKDKEKKKIEARIQAIDNELATQNIDAERVRLQKEIDALESVAFAAQSAKEAIDKDLGVMGSRKQEIGVELLRIAAEQKNANDQIQKVTQAEKDEVRDKEQVLAAKRAALMGNNQEERAEMYIGQIAEQVLESWKKEVQGKPGAESAEARKNFDYTAEHDQLTKQTTTLKTRITQVPSRTRQKELKAQLKTIEDKIAELDEDTPDVEKSMLKLWKDLGDLEVSIDQFMPVGSVDQEEPEVREAREARERRVVTRELPSYMINELLDSRKIQFGEIVKMIYEEKLVTTTEQGE